MTSSTRNNADRLIVLRAVARLRALVMAITFGMTGGVGLFLATVWLLVRGGENVGEHLGLLANYLPGYTVTWGGAFLGLVYGVAGGGAIGAAIAFIYNLLASVGDAGSRTT